MTEENKETEKKLGRGERQKKQREERMAAALRENLRKRKAQQRSKDEVEKDEE
jgi:hypothetical protein